MQSRPVELIPGKLCFVTSNASLKATYEFIPISTDICLSYVPVGRESGPFNIGQCFRFFEQLHTFFHRAERAGKRLLFYSRDDANQKANCLVLLALYMIIVLNDQAKRVFERIQCCRPYAPFFDVSGRGFSLQVHDFIFAAERLRNCYEFHLRDFNLQFYEFYLQRQSAQITMVLPGRLEVFSFAQTPLRECITQQHSMAACMDLFYAQNVQIIVKTFCYTYSSTRSSQCIECCALDFEDDSSVPTAHGVAKFFSICRKHHGLIALQGSQGWGAVGTLVCCYLIRFLGFSARYAIALARLYRPGSVIGAQQAWICENYGLLSNPQAFTQTRCFYESASPEDIKAPEMDQLRADRVNYLARTFVNSPTRRLRVWQAACESPFCDEKRPQSCLESRQVVIKSGRVISGSASSPPTFEKSRRKLLKSAFTGHGTTVASQH